VPCFFDLNVYFLLFDTVILVLCSMSMKTLMTSAVASNVTNNNPPAGTDYFYFFTNAHNISSILLTQLMSIS